MAQVPEYNAAKYGIWGVLEAKNFGVYGQWSPRKGQFISKEGILTAGIQIAEPDKLAPWPTDSTINPYGNTNSAVSYPVSATAPSYDGFYGYTMYKYDKNNTDNTVALQLQNSEDGVITSDYALIVPTRVQLEGLIWAKKPQYKEPKLAGRDYPTPYYYGEGADDRFGDEEGWAKDENWDCTVVDDPKSRIHIWDSPEEALNDSCGAALELYVGDQVDLKEYLGVHFVKETLKKKETAPGVLNPLRYEIGTWTYGQEAAFGLHYEFELVDYYDSSNQTRDSRYAAWNDWDGTWANWNKNADGTLNRTGVLKVKNVNAAGQTIDEESRTSVDREPLVRVLLKNANGGVLLDGYILLHINHQNDNKEIVYTEQPKTFNLCDGIFMETEWSEFSNLLLHQGMNQQQILGFNDYFFAEAMTGGTIQEDDDKYVTADARYVGTVEDGHGRGYQLRIYNFGDKYGKNISAAAQAKMNNGSASEYEETQLPAASGNFQSNQGLGVVTYFPNGEGTTNHIIRWYLSPEEVEWLTHDKKESEYPVTVSRWVRYTSKDEHRGRADNNYSAPYPYMWVKLTMVISRKEETLTYKTKIDNYWYNYQNAVDATGWSGIIFDITAPGSTTESIADKPWNSFISQTLTANGVDDHYTLTSDLGANTSYNKKSKYYFAPKSYKITSQNGAKTYTISPENKSYNQADLNIKPNATEDDLTKFDMLYCKYVYTHSYDNVNNRYNPAIVSVVGEEGLSTPLKRNKHTWSEKALTSSKYEIELEQILRTCAIDYNAGVFNDSILYATINNVSTPIARIVKQRDGQDENNVNTYRGAGQIELIHWLPVGATKTTAGAKENVVLYDVLNALGYPMKDDGTCDFDNARKFINKQLRAWVGVVANNGCDVALYVKQEKSDTYDSAKDFEVKANKAWDGAEYTISPKDDNKWNPVATILVSWERPINLNLNPITPALDANTNENTVYLLDYLKLFDWRGDKNHQGYMYNGTPNHWWFWPFYNVKGIKVDLDPAKVYTNMHQTSTTTFVKMNTIQTRARFYALRPDGTLAQTHNYGQYWLTDGTPMGTSWWLPYTPVDLAKSAQESLVEQHMGLNPRNEINLRKFGAFYYENNGDNVTVFDIKFPITIYYEWGSFEYYVDWHIDTTHGRN
jgi:hypothetical protein